MLSSDGAVAMATFWHDRPKERCIYGLGCFAKAWSRDLQRVRVGIACGTQGGITWSDCGRMTPTELLEVQEDVVEFQTESRAAAEAEMKRQR